MCDLVLNKWIYVRSKSFNILENYLKNIYDSLIVTNKYMFKQSYTENLIGECA